ncbi:YihA family ribosome biogenesis GTP-binding protein [Thiomicrospira microaerophila]|uniref:ribosome biogenesis GTP-binding protein YihA/YsxC n=1 Tax=Thiomicrospira microaerophila TaxID=406020 RepID=UPI00201090E1|nr:ribosome biogenesis GTP-binding protein YihA/YsxC [Thiomicrospira microaerophila]UQB42289.1 YihA family ribosome biogenesis GTP-binding protein [Thiomicrospira microaerophila]
MQHPLYQKATYLKSAPNLSHCPEDVGYEVAFAGRSNAGKSSALNVLTSQKSLARTSKTPGRTQMINFFQLDEQRSLIDLPGYGFAKVNVNVKKLWEAGLAEYVEKREALKGLILMMDVRHPLQPLDKMMLDWTHELNLPVHVLLTKADKLSRNQASQALMGLQKTLKHNYPHASAQLFSSLNKQGLDQAWSKLDEWMEFERTN